MPDSRTTLRLPARPRAAEFVRHADELAGRLGEPCGTLILTLSVTAIDSVSISFATATAGSPRGCATGAHRPVGRVPPDPDRFASYVLLIFQG